MAKVDSLLERAIIETDKEIFAEGMDLEAVTLDETGDRSLEAMGAGLEGQHEPEEDDADDEEQDAEEKSETEGEGESKEEVEAKAETDTKEPPQEPQGRVPSGRLREEAEKTRAAQAERDQMKAERDALKAEEKAYRQELAELKAKFEGFLAARRESRQEKNAIEPPPAPETPPDILEDPAGYAAFIQRRQEQATQGLQGQLRAMQVNHSMELASVKHGKAFADGFSALKSLDKSTPENRDLMSRILSAPNPGEAVVAWHKRNEVSREIGDDLEGFKARIAREAREAARADEEFRKQVFEDMRAEAMSGNQGRPRTETRLPPSLGRTPGGNGRAPNDREIYDDADSSVFHSAFR